MFYPQNSFNSFICNDFLYNCLLMDLFIYLFIYYLGILITTEHKGAFLFFVYLFVCPLVSLSVCLPVSPFVFWPFVCLFVC